MFTGILHLYTECYAINSYRDPVALFPNSNKSENLFQLIFLNYRLISTLSNWFCLTITSTYLLCLITINIQFYSFTARFYLFWIMATDGNIRIDLTKWKMFEIHWLTTHWNDERFFENCVVEKISSWMTLFAFNFDSKLNNFSSLVMDDLEDKRHTSADQHFNIWIYKWVKDKRVDAFYCIIKLFA